MSEIGKRLDRPIILVGLMGAGKSTVGPRLAERLSVPFVDSDHAIEESAGCPVAEIFDRFGEADFRARERRMIEQLAAGEPSVIAVGGGAFVDRETRDLLNQRAVTIWLDAPVAVLARRTGQDDARPLLRTADTISTLEKLAHERRRFYAQAHLRIDSSADSPDEVADATLRALSDRFE